jgi:WD40 repeat protein
MAGPTSTGFADGGRIVYLLAPGGLKLWRAVDGAQLPAPPSAGYAPKAIAAAASAPRLALLLSRRGGGAETEILDPIAQRSSVVARESAGHVAIDERGIRVALAEGRRVHLIELATGHARWLNVRGGSADFRLLAFSGDGRRLAVGGADFLDIFSVSDGKLVGSLPSPARTQLASLALSYTGTVVAGGYSDLRARLWTATGDKLLMMAKEPEQPDEAGAGVTTVQISRDGSFLLTSASGASDIEIWDIASGSRLYAFNGFFAGWSDSAQLVLTTGGPLQSWACDVCTGPSQLRRLASTRVTRGFTPGERAKFLTQ